VATVAELRRENAAQRAQLGQLIAANAALGPAANWPHWAST
jgi:hypothetical protein